MENQVAPAVGVVAADNVRVHPVQRSVVMLLGGVLLSAATLKAYWPTLPTPHGDWLSSSYVTAATAIVEVIIGIGLVSGLYPRAVWAAAALCFTVFAVVTIYKGTSGLTSCGCFGRASVNPWYLATFDVCAVGALTAFRPRVMAAHHRARITRGRKQAWAAALLCGVMFVGWPVLGRMMDRGTGAAEPPKSGPVVLLPDTWIGKPFPLTPYTDLSAPVDSGRWLLVLHRTDCQLCREAVSHIAGLARPGQLGVALIEVPPYRDDVGDLRPGAALVARLSDSRDWVVETPVVALVEAKTVRAVAEGRNALNVRYDNDGKSLVGF